MSYHTASYFLLFLPVVLLAYQLFPQKTRWIVLIAASCVCYWSISGKLIIFIFGAALFTHYAAVWMTWLRENPSGTEAERRRSEKAVLAFGILGLLSVLGYLKYYNFFVENGERLFSVFGLRFPLQVKELLLPLGISFYTLQAVGYLLDVYWKNAEVCRHPGKTMLFLSFFPIIMEGPLCAYSQTADDLWKGEPIRAGNFTQGCVRILWGLFKKLIIADRLNVMVCRIFDHHEEYQGVLIAVAAVAYTVQLYMEFSGSIDIVIGSGTFFGVRIPENFRQPFFAADAAEFWRRWHISLGTWLRTYVFYPVSVSRPVKRWNRYARKRLGRHAAGIGALAMALFPVWLCNGLWHGPKWNYIFYGMYYFAVLLFTAIFDPVRDAVLNRLGIDKNAAWYRAIRIVKTWPIIFTGELFFRANGLRAGMAMFRSMFRGLSVSRPTAETWLALGLDQGDYLAITAACAVVLVVGIIKEKQLLGEDGLLKLRRPVRWCIYYGLIFSVVIFGAYGTGYQPVDLIYAGF